MDNLADLSLIEQIRRGDHQAKEQLVCKYMPMVRSIINRYYAQFHDQDDLFQEGLIGLLNAIQQYKPDAFEAKFSSFAYTCILRKTFNTIKKSQSHGHRTLNEAISLHAVPEERGGPPLVDVIPCNQDTPSRAVEEQLAQETIDDVLQTHLSRFEYCVALMLCNGYSIDEISRHVGVTSKAVDNARTRIKSKLKRLLHSHGTLVSATIPKATRQRRDLYLAIEFVSPLVLQ